MSFLNDQGYWLYNQAAPATEWAFSFDPESAVSFAAQYPEEWVSFQESGSGTLNTRNGYFCYTSIQPSELLSSSHEGSVVTCDVGTWYIVTFIPKSSRAGAVMDTGFVDLARASLSDYYPFYIVLFLFSLVLAGFVTSSQIKSNQVKFFSEYDAMTGAYNRRAGIEKLSYLYKNLSKFKCQLSVCFIDINGLKEVNDTLGHEAGDEKLITTVANTVRTKIRTDDFLIRLGGDEFLIVFQGVDDSQAEHVWSRVIAEFEAINQTKDRKYLISVSHGIMMLSCGFDQILDNVLHQADTKCTKKSD